MISGSRKCSRVTTDAGYGCRASAEFLWTVWILLCGRKVFPTQKAVVAALLPRPTCRRRLSYSETSLSLLCHRLTRRHVGDVTEYLSHSAAAQDAISHDVRMGRLRALHASRGTQFVRVGAALCRLLYCMPTP